MKQLKLTIHFGVKTPEVPQVIYYNGEAYLKNESDSKLVKKKLL